MKPYNWYVHCKRVTSYFASCFQYTKCVCGISCIEMMLIGSCMLPIIMSEGIKHPRWVQRSSFYIRVGRKRLFFPNLIRSRNKKTCIHEKISVRKFELDTTKKFPSRMTYEKQTFSWKTGQMYRIPRFCIWLAIGSG